MAKKAKKKRTGPAPDTLRIEGDWKVAVRVALKKPRPPGGWPKKPAPATRKKAKP